MEMSEQDFANLKWWLKNNVDIALQEDEDPLPSIDDTIEAFQKTPDNFEIPE